MKTLEFVNYINEKIKEEYKQATINELQTNTEWHQLCKDFQAVQNRLKTAEENAKHLIWSKQNHCQNTLEKLQTLWDDNSKLNQHEKWGSPLENIALFKREMEQALQNIKEENITNKNSHITHNLQDLSAIIIQAEVKTAPEETS